jgi:hypothetical protein
METKASKYEKAIVNESEGDEQVLEKFYGACDEAERLDCESAFAAAVGFSRLMCEHRPDLIRLVDTDRIGGNPVRFMV